MLLPANLPPHPTSEANTSLRPTTTGLVFTWVYYFWGWAQVLSHLWNFLLPMLSWAQNWFPVCLLCELLEGRDHGLGPLFIFSPWQHAWFGVYSMNVGWLASVSTKVITANIYWTLPVCKALFYALSFPQTICSSRNYPIKQVISCPHFTFE